MQKTYKVIRFHRDNTEDNYTVKAGLTLEEAQEHCRREDTHGDGWFDGYTDYGNNFTTRYTKAKR